MKRQKAQKLRQARVQLSALKSRCCAFTAGENCSASCPKPFFEMIFFLHDISTNPITAKKAGKCKKSPKVVRFRGARSHNMLFCFAIWLQGEGFFIARSKTLSPPFANSIVGSPPCFLPCALPFSAAGCGRAPSPLSPQGRSVSPVPADKKGKKTPMRLFSFLPKSD